MKNHETYEKHTKKTLKRWRKSIHYENDEHKPFGFDLQGSELSKPIKSLKWQPVEFLETLSSFLLEQK